MGGVFRLAGDRPTLRRATCTKRPPRSVRKRSLAIEVRKELVGVWIARDHTAVQSRCEFPKNWEVLGNERCPSSISHFCELSTVRSVSYSTHGTVSLGIEIREIIVATS